MGVLGVMGVQGSALIGCMLVSHLLLLTPDESDAACGDLDEGGILLQC